MRRQTYQTSHGEISLPSPNAHTLARLKKAETGKRTPGPSGFFSPSEASIARHGPDRPGHSIQQDEQS